MKKNTFLYLLLSLLTIQAYAKEFRLGGGEETFSWGSIVPNLKKESDLKLKLGFRLQGAMEQASEETNGTTETASDFYLRRLRFQFEGKFLSNAKFYMDIRNDKVGKGDKGDGQFTIGDAFIQTQLTKGNFSNNMKLFRAKVDVSRTQTVSSSRLLLHDRAKVTDFAAEYVSAGRRANNVQFNGNWKKKIHYHVAIGDGVEGNDFEDAKENVAQKIVKQKFMVGGKVKISPFKGWEERKVKETYMGRGKHFTLGAGYFSTAGIEFENKTTTHTISRTLANLEASAHYNGLSVQAEYFQFNNQIEDLEAANLNVGTSSGYYVQGEYVFRDFYYLSPMVRYESWDKFEEKEGYGLTSKVLGTNYYMKGNKIRLGLFFQQDEYEASIAANTQTDNIVKLTTQLHY